MDTGNNRYLQCDFQYFGVPFQVQTQLYLEKFSMHCRYKNCELCRTADRSSLEHGFEHNADLEWNRLVSVDDRHIQHYLKHEGMQVQM